MTFYILVSHIKSAYTFNYVQSRVYKFYNNNNNIYLKSNIHSITRYKFSRLYKKHGIHNLAVQCILKYQEKAST